MLKQLVLAFDCEEGLPEAIYHQVRELLCAMLGENCSQVFIHYVNATEGRFYIKEGEGMSCWRDIVAELNN